MRTTERKTATSILFQFALVVRIVLACSACTPPVAAQSLGQPKPGFEVASIKPVVSVPSHPPDTMETNVLMAMGRGSRNGLFSMRRVPLGLLIQLAYNIQDSQLVGGPYWINSDRYEIAAKTEGKATFEQMRPMLQSLLAERFKLTLRHETKELPVYELVVAKGGLKIHAAKEGACVDFDEARSLPRIDPNRPAPPLNVCGGVRREVLSGSPERKDRIDAVAVSIPRLIDFISDEVHRFVVDKTGFIEKFDFHLEFSPSEVSSASVGTGVSIFTALQQKLGLRLEAARRLVSVLVIDHVERPSEN